MKIKDGYVLRAIAGQHMAIPVGKRVNDLHGMIALNETGAFLWKLLESDISREELIRKLTEEYEVSEEAAGAALDDFVVLLKNESILDRE